MALTDVTVTGKYVKEAPAGDGTLIAASGTISFALSDVLHDPVDSQMVVPDVITETLDSSGTFSVVLKATDDTSVFPSGLVYNVTENIEGVQRTYVIQLTHTVISVDISTLAPSGSGAMVGLLATLVTTDPSTWTMISGANVQAALNEVDTLFASRGSFTQGQDIRIGALITGAAEAYAIPALSDYINSRDVDLSRSLAVFLTDFAATDPQSKSAYVTGQWLPYVYEAYQDALVAGTAVDLKRHGIVGLPDPVSSVQDSTKLRSLSGYIDAALTAGSLDVELHVNGSAVTYTPKVWTSQPYSGWTNSVNATIVSTTSGVDWHATAAGDTEIVSPAIAVTDRIDSTKWLLYSDSSISRIATITTEFLDASNAIVGTSAISLHLASGPGQYTPLPYDAQFKPSTATQVRFRVSVAGALTTETYTLSYSGPHGWGSEATHIFAQDDPGGAVTVKLTFTPSSGQVVTLDFGDPTIFDRPFIYQNDLVTFHAIPSGTLAPVPKVVVKADFVTS